MVSVVNDTNTMYKVAVSVPDGSVGDSTPCTMPPGSEEGWMRMGTVLVSVFDMADDLVASISVDSPPIGNVTVKLSKLGLK